MVWVVCAAVALIVSQAPTTTHAANIEDAAYWRKLDLTDLKQSLKKERIEGPAKNIVLFIGDGMGIQTQTMARIYKGQKEGKTGEEGTLFWEKFPYSGLIKTYNTDHQVPDSAGTATAIMSGVKTSFGVLGIDNTVKRGSCDMAAFSRAKVDNLLDWSRSVNKMVGVVTTARITHATPGALYAHTTDRNWEADINIPEDKKQCKDIASQLVTQLLEGNLGVAMGGGLRNFRTKKNGGLREDQDLVDYLKSKNIKVATNTGELKEWDYKTPLVGLFGMAHMDYEAKRNKTYQGQPSLEEMTRQALTKLKMSKEGFFLLVEAGRIDHGHHDNKAKMALEETVMLDKTVAAVLDLVDVKDTLLMVTADHSHAVTMSGYPVRGNNILGVVKPNEYTKEYVVTTLDNKKQPYQTISYANGPGFWEHFDNNTNFWRNISKMQIYDNDYRQPAMFDLPDETHGGEDVAVYARGPQAHHVTGLHEQGYLAVLLGYAGCLNNRKFGCPTATSSSQSVDSGVSVLLTGLLWIIQQ